MTYVGKPVLGILGGLGPVASAEFLRTIYNAASWTKEQEAPTVLLHSDATFSDRSRAFLSGNSWSMLEKLIDALHRLVNAGASRLVICCVTMHYLVPELPQVLRERVISLLDCVFDEVAEHDTRCLLLCSTGTRRLHLFESHPRWTQLRRQFVLPTEEDQELIHSSIIYSVKAKNDTGNVVGVLESLLLKYAVTGFIAGCTEIHVLESWLRDHPEIGRRYRCVDPLTFTAHRFLQEFQHAREHSLCI